MSANAKLSILQNVLESEFDQLAFQGFVKEFFNEPEMLQASRKTGIWREYNDHISSYSIIAKYTDREDNELIILSVELMKNQSVERARTMQRNFISKVLEQQGYDAAVVAFYSPNELNWRLSFVRLDYTFTEKGLEIELTPARRFSYLVGEGEPSHTAKEQLLSIFENDKLNPTLDEIENAFSVEKVTKEFFEQYKEKYLQLKEYLEQDESFIKETSKLGFEVPKFAEQFAKKLLGQLSFLYFIQKKGWLGVRILPRNHILLESDYERIYIQNDEAHRIVLEKVFVKSNANERKISLVELFNLSDHETELFSNCFVRTEFNQPWGNGDRKFISTIFNNCINNKDKNFFDDYLEPLFYDALNKKRKNHYFNKFNCKIPFLNGGLFEPLEGYHWRDVNFSIPNSLFSNEKEKGRAADGILDIFERYNFTMNEDEPLEKEVAVDPEMLGKIFENLLDVQDRKSKGAFYTPREVVHYMCQESLVNFLVNKIDLPYEETKEFILYGELIRDTDNRSVVGNSKDFIIKPSILNNIVKIDKALENIKIADPAVGSGAFPLGLLSEIVKARNTITDYLVLLDREGKFERRFGETLIRKNRSPYKLKRNTIKNSIFAVDIEASAIDIAKLRLWLSVIVDQEINEETPEPRPLPNLDMNIMVGNSLVDDYEGIKLFDESILKKKNISESGTGSEYHDYTQQLSFLVDYSDEMLKEMFKLQDRYFDEVSEERKHSLKDRIDKLRDDLIEYKLDRDGNKDSLKKFEELKNTKYKPYFLWYLEFAKVFQENGGFDIVVGNPPYGVTISDQEKNKFELSSKDSYGAFTIQGINLLASEGTLCYIMSDTWQTIKSHKPLRNFVLKNTELKLIMSMPLNTFGATVNTGIYLMNKKPIAKINKNNIIFAVDLSSLDINNHIFKSALEDFKNIKQTSYNQNSTIVYNDKYAIYCYFQSEVEKYSNLSLFIASPKLYQLMNDTDTNVFMDYIIEFNNEKIKVSKLRAVADVKQGLATGDNNAYLYQYPEARGKYKNINDYKEYLLTEEDLREIQVNELLRLEIIEKGINIKDTNSKRYFNGRFIIPYDKGGESDAKGGWMPNYHVPTNYFIDWSEDAIKRIKSLTIAERIRINNEKKPIKPKHEKALAAVIRNPSTYFKYGITYSRTGVYAPTYRIGNASVYDTEGSTIFLYEGDTFAFLGHLCSKLSKYLLKNYIGHTVHCQVEELKELPLSKTLLQSEKVARFTNDIILKQKENLRYNYAQNEQIVIDSLVYNVFKLTESDIDEIETWYKRRYPNIK